MPSPSPSPSPSDVCAGETPRVSSAEVLEILLVEDESKWVQTPSAIDPFILAAHLMVDELIVAPEDCNLSDCVLREIERWLAAHLLTTVDPKTVSEKYGDAEDKFQGKWTEGLASTSYGQQAMILDACGKLGTQNAKVKKPTRKLIFQARGR